MYFGLCIYDTLGPDGRLESINIFPAQSTPSLVVDHLRDVGPKLDSDVDLGPLRFYTRDEGLRVRTSNSLLMPPRFERDGNSIKFSIEHLHIPLPRTHAGYYILLLPSGFGGQIRTSPDYGETIWLEDTQQLFINLTATPDHNYIEVSGILRDGKQPESEIATSTFAELFGRSLPGIYYSPVDNLIRALQHNFDQSIPSAFVCHSSNDKEDARRLAVNLATRGIRPWIDEAEIKIGDSLIEKLQEGIDASTCLLPLLSESSVNSRWCREELRMALAQQITGAGKRVLPIKLGDCDIPGFLRDKAYLDLSEYAGYDDKIDRLASEIRELANAG
ncbi:toll/interleukin-1 receptor domain-containing protein [Candidatus Eisenbacteria bacterium]|uniref:Toll/interleukin-1 receptor domain-containing protein n=1 Tax=Eiseniibacteriota bacterium TaxID=2212470 RepID=A0ABV6YLN5_UNCEI